jgi:glutathione S-transferase
LVTLAYSALGRTLFIQAFFSPNKDETYPKHQKTDRANFLNALESHLKSNNLSTQGPFVIGKEITYADMVIYQICHDENLVQDGRKGLKEYPRLTQLVDAVESRLNVKAFLLSERYLG